MYDLSGNVYEWCEDWFDEKYYAVCHEKGVAENLRGPEQGVNRVLRGGDWGRGPQDCRPACRNASRPDSRYGNFGFRLALSLQADG